MKNRNSKAAQYEEDEEDDEYDDDDDDDDDVEDNTAAGFSGALVPTPSPILKKENSLVAGSGSSQYQSTVGYEGFPFSRALSATSDSQSVSPYGFDRLTLQEGMGSLPGFQGVQEQGMILQQPMQGFQDSHSSNYPLAPMQPLQQAYPIPGQYGMNNVYEWHTSTPPMPGSYNNEFVGFAVPPVDPSTYVQTFDGLPGSTQPWLEYSQQPLDNPMAYWSQAYHQTTPHSGIFYQQ